ncbi:MAG: exodeoxyribonuclease VII small subunit [Chloroflexi bacterium]|nr:exodeoxyribonuclease VII small subunit [Chloroflexota bacterium]
MVSQELNLSFEEAYARLEEIVARLEAGELSLDESLALYEEGQRIAQHCGALLDAAELRVEQVNDDDTLSPLGG